MSETKDPLRDVSWNSRKRVFGLSIFAVLLFAMFAGSQFFSTMSAKAVTWSSEFEVNTDVDKEADMVPLVASGEDGAVHVVWTENDHQAIFYRLFDGEDWQPEINLSGDMGGEASGIAIDGKHVYVVWRQGLEYDIVLKHYNGTGWEPNVKVSDDGGWTKLHPDVAAENGKVHVVWQDVRDGDCDIYYRRYNGNSWEPVKEISSDKNRENQRSPRITAEDGKVYVIWTDEEYHEIGLEHDVYFRFHDGTSWQPIEEISKDNDMEIQYGGGVAVENGNAHAIWYQHGDCFYSKRNETSWNTEQLDTGPIPQHSCQGGGLVAEGGRVHATWKAATWGPNDYDEFYRMYDGSEWLPVERITKNMTGRIDNSWPMMAVDDGKIHIVFNRIFRTEDPYDQEDWDVIYVKGEFVATQESGSPARAYRSADPTKPLRGNWESMYRHLPADSFPEIMDSDEVRADNPLRPEPNSETELSSRPTDGVRLMSIGISMRLF